MNHVWAIRTLGAAVIFAVFQLRSRSIILLQSQEKKEHLRVIIRPDLRPRETPRRSRFNSHRHILGIPRIRVVACREAQIRCILSDVERRGARSLNLRPAKSQSGRLPRIESECGTRKGAWDKKGKRERQSSRGTNGRGERRIGEKRTDVSFTVSRAADVIAAATAATYPRCTARFCWLHPRGHSHRTTIVSPLCMSAEYGDCSARLWMKYSAL